MQDVDIHVHNRIKIILHALLVMVTKSLLSTITLYFYVTCIFVLNIVIIG